MSSDEGRFLRRRHESWSTPRELVSAIVRRASGNELAQGRRIVAGEANEVWDVTTSDGVELIVRISHWDTFGREAWAVRQCQLLGVPVPDVLLVEDAVPLGNGEQIATWVHRKVKGETLQQLGAKSDVRDLTMEAGELLAIVHEVRTAGFGWIDHHGRGEEGAWTDWLGWDEAALRDARAAGLSSSDLEHAVGWLDNYQDLLARTSSRLLHGDWGAVHVLARDGRVVALIDFGSARAGDSAFDFARWDLVFDRPQHPTADLLEGYRRMRDPGPQLDVRRALCLLAHVKYLAPYFAKDGREGPLALMKYRFGEALAWLRANA